MRTKGSGGEAEKPECESVREAPVERLWEAKQGRAKGNEQRAEYGKPEGAHGRPGRTDGGERGSESGIGNCGSHCEAEAGIAERKNRGLSSQNRMRSERK